MELILLAALVGAMIIVPGALFGRHMSGKVIKVLDVVRAKYPEFGPVEGKTTGNKTMRGTIEGAEWTLNSALANTQHVLSVPVSVPKGVTLEVTPTWIPSDDTLPWLGSRVRRALDKCRNAGFQPSVEDGRLIVARPMSTIEAKPSEIVTMVERAMALRHQLQAWARKGTRHRLKEMATKDPEPEFARHAARLVLTGAGDDDTTAQAVYAACVKHADPGRRQQAILWDHAGTEALAAARAMILDGAVAHAFRAPVASRIPSLMDSLDVDDADRETIRQELKTCAARNNGELLVAAVDALMVSGSAPDARWLASQIGKASKSARLGLVPHLAAMPDAEQPLVSLLDDSAPGVVEYVAEALGRIGTHASLAPLNQLRGETSFGSVKRAASKAVGAIEARHGRLTRGGVSLVEDALEEGALSVSEAEEGALAVTA